jgi:hypothetical protein
MKSFATLVKLYPSIKEHRQVEATVLGHLDDLLESRFIAPPPRRRTGTLQYTRKNFFSILFLAVYRSMGISEERRLLYGTINHAIRGIVTAADNILDDEYKEMLPLRFADGASRFKSIMHLLLFDRILYRMVDDAVERRIISPGDRPGILQTILDALVPIGEEEATEEGGVSHILTPEEIIHQIHRHKGGNLLRLAFVAPLMVETGRRERVELAARGVFRIGLALQVIDDLTDFYQDLRDRRHNYLVSTIHHEGTRDEQARLAALLSGRGDRLPVELAYAASAARAMARAIGEALDGFERLHAAGFWLDRPQALELIRYLFVLRGVGHLLPLLPAGDQFTQTLEIHRAA